MNNLEQKFIKTVCPHCKYTSYFPNNFLSILKFWKYETIIKACPDLMDCIKNLNEKLNSATTQAILHSVSKTNKCSRCPHCTHCSLLENKSD